MRKVILCIFLNVSFLAISQNVNIPDANFKNYLINNPAVNSNNDSEIQQSEALAFTGTLAFQFYLIEDLTGIEAFVNLTVLDCGDNNLTTLDLSQNTALLELYCYDNQIESLDLSANTALQVLDCRNNQILNLDVSSNTELYYLSCPFNEMVSLNVQNTVLTTLRCYSNQLTTLDVSTNMVLDTLICDYNNLLELDLSNNSVLTIADCDYNELTSLNLANTNNSNITFFDARNNENLNCVQVDNVDYANANWTNIEDITTFSEDCSSLSSLKFDSSNFNFYPNPVGEVLNITLLEEAFISIVSLKGQIVTTKKLVKGINRIDMSFLSKGVYLIKIKTTSISYYSRVLKM